MATADSQVGQVGSREVERPQVVDAVDNDGNGISEEAAKNEPAPVIEASAPVEPPLYSVFTARQKRMTVIIVSFVAMISPLSGTIYYPALTSLAADLNVSISLIQLSITTYQVKSPTSLCRTLIPNNKRFRSSRVLPRRSLRITRTATVENLLTPSASSSTWPPISG